MKGVCLVQATRALAAEFADHPKMKALDFDSVAAKAEGATQAVAAWLEQLEAVKLPYAASQGAVQYRQLLVSVKESMHQVKFKIMFLLFISFYK